MKASTMMKAVEDYLRLGNIIQIKFSFDKSTVVYGGEKAFKLHLQNYQKSWRES